MHDEKPSATALLIAKSQLLLAKDPLYYRFIDQTRKEYYRKFVEEVTGTDFSNSFISRYWLKFVEYISIPGIYLHYALRKKVIEQTSREFLEHSAIEQIVMIAAGFDPLLAILSMQYKHVEFFELDHKATQQPKNKALRKLNKRDNLTLIPVDLTKESVYNALLNTKFSPHKKTIFIAEGITMYLDEAEIINFFQQVKLGLQNSDSYLIFSYMNKQKSGSIQFESARKLVNYWLHYKKEIFKWGIETDNITNFLVELGFHLVNLFDVDYLTRQYLTNNEFKDVKLAKGENICLVGVSLLNKSKIS